MSTSPALTRPVPHSSQPHRDEWDPQPPASPGQPTSPRLQTFFTSAHQLAQQLDSTTAHPQSTGDPIGKAMLSNLLDRLNEQPESTRPALFTWLLLRATYSAARASELYDELELRTGLAQTFAAFNLHGEQGWRAAAQVHLLLTTDTIPLTQTVTRDSFWSNPDTHWLAGIDATGKYVNKESFEQLIALLAFPSATPSTQQADILAIASQANYSVQPLVRALARQAPSNDSPSSNTFNQA